MKIWKSLLILALIFLVSWGGFWLYQNYFSSRKINSLQLIHPDAVFVFETYQADQTWNELVKQPIWDILSKFPAFAKTSENLVSLDSLAGSNGEISRILRGKQVTVSYHASGIESFELLFTVNFKAKSPLDFLEEIKSRAPHTIRIQTRKYSDIEIYEFFGKDNSRKWTVTVLGNILLASASSFIVEEAIRLYISADRNSLASKLETHLDQKSDMGRLIFSANGVSKLLDGISADRENFASKELALNESLFALNLTFEDGQISFKGPAILEQQINFTPSLRANYPEIQKLISNRTQAITQINLDGIFETQKLQNAAFSPKSTISGEIQNRLTDRGFLDNFSGEFYYLDLENLGNQIKNQVVLAKILDPAQTLAFLKEFRNNSDLNQSDYYRDSEILFFPEEEFPAHLFGGKFIGFPQTHISMIGDILIMANTVPGMKMILDDFALGNTWAKAPDYSPGHRAINPAAGYSKTFLLDKIWGKWEKNTNPAWSPFLQIYSSVFKTFPYLSFRINQIGGIPEASLVLPYNVTGQAPTIKNSGLSLTPSKTITLSDNITYGPKVILNFNDKTEDIVVQDANHILHLINSSGENVYSVKLSGPVVSEAFQIDFLKNGKLQLLLATAEHVYAIDRLGNPLAGFPVSLNERITHLSLVDYDNTREYRYFLATESGNLWLLDRSGKELDGWNPLKLGERMTQAPRHIRVPGKGDYMVAQSLEGKIHFFNRRGEKQAGSPLSLGNSFIAPINVTTGSGGNTLKISAISQAGELIHASFGGEITYRTQLIKADRDTKFELLADQSGHSEVILSRQYSKTLILDEQEKELFTLPLAGDNLRFSYFDFGADRRILAVSDIEQGFGYLYDLRGRMLTTTPLESEGPIHISHQPTRNRYNIRTVSGSRIMEYLMPD
ncbi:hypothetical protein [Algoriphagus sp.]|uniref:hypothetical protein n=1 Tax=Algoriphagus sp. TaxID=1872435 RepID=UPI00391BD20D